MVTTITVAASNQTDGRWTPAQPGASSSNVGHCVNLYAPGVGITSAYDIDDSATKTADGTSMSCPHVSGVIALYLQDNPTATPAEVSLHVLP